MSRGVLNSSTSCMVARDCAWIVIVYHVPRAYPKSYIVSRDGAEHVDPRGGRIGNVDQKDYHL